MRSFATAAPCAARAPLHCATLVVTLCMLVAPAAGAERTVLCEEFTDLFCHGCSYAGPALSQLVDIYPDSFAFIQLHPFDDYATEWSVDRWGFYDGQGTPTAVFNGTDLLAGSVQSVDQQYTIYRANHFLPARAMETDVTVSVSGSPLSGQTYRITTEVGIEAGGVGKTLYVYVVQVLDNWPPEKPYHRNTLKQSAPLVEVVLEPGESQVIEHDLTFDEDSWSAQEDIRIIAWAQQALDEYPAEVYQAAVRSWPLITAPGDEDGDGYADDVDNCPTRYNPGQDDFDGDGVGNDCDNCLEDYNPDQLDGDEDRVGDACDNCPVLHHIDQTDTDGDSVGDKCDSCPEVAGPAGVDQFGRPRGGIDVDCDVDMDDVALLAICLVGPDVTTVPPECDAEEFARADTDDDGDVDLRDTFALAQNFTGALVSPALYVGEQTCLSCHTENHAEWLGTAHATAIDTLIASGDENNVLCFPCHTVGYGEAGGFVDLATTPVLANVQCENCHGAGSNHQVDPELYPLTVDVSSNLCGVCHQSCHGLCGEDHHPQYEQWQTSVHANALWDIMVLPEYEESCLPCHSADYRLAPEDNKPGIWEVFYSVECVTCHDQHSVANEGQLRLPPRELCGDCHTMQGVVPDAIPSQPQNEMLHSTGGWSLENERMEGPYSEHWYGIPNECVTCHVHFEPYGGPQQPVNSGHTFEANMRACEPCHTEATATLLVEVVQEEVSTRLAYIARYYDPDDPLYLSPGDVPPEDIVAYANAQFDYELLQADRSLGVHSPAYARALLREIEEFFEIPPWFRQPGAVLEAAGERVGVVRVTEVSR